MKRIRIMAAGLVALAMLASCEGGIGRGVRDVPPGSCEAGQRVCHWDPIKEVETVLRCNAGEVPDAIWLIDVVCEPGDLCTRATCTPPS
ncbi:MAG: hypothetical protein H6746_01895 [Deltaproteobacteria bacterium]|nr:hypothetical protein [Deltaproteobacteria bacterium]